MTDGPVVLVSAEKEVAELLREAGFSTLGFLDPQAEAAVPGLPHLGDDAEWDALVRRYAGLSYVLALDPPLLKRKVAERFSLDRLRTAISPAAHLSPHAILGDGCVVQRGCVVMPDARLGRGCKVNLGAAIHHDCQIGNWCTIAPGARLLGNVVLGDGVFVGASATILPRIRVGAGATIGASAVVTRDVAEGATVVGVPARPLKKDKSL